jgi:two-component system, OmpR family, sensor histidine kinase SenX3
VILGATVPVAVFGVAIVLVLVLSAVLVAELVARRRLAERLKQLADRADPERRHIPATVSADDATLTRLERSVDRLLEQERDDADVRLRLDRALGAIPEGVVVTDQQGNVVLRNTVADRFAEARHGDALVEAAIDELVAEVLESGRAASRTLDLFGPPRRALVIDVAPLLGEGRAIGALVLIGDVTERRRLEAVRRDFVANISHELKTPVGALSLLAETMIGETDPDVSRRLAERMMNEAIRVAHTIEDLIQLSRIEAEEDAVREAVSLQQIVAEAATRLRPAAEQAGIELDVAEPNPRLTLLGDRRQLVSAVSNLIDNAVKYSDTGSTVEVRTGADAQGVSISVIDHGIGIPARDLERVFERFYRVDHARSRQTGGTGLGLAIVRHVVNNHEGEIDVDSRMGEGSTFTLRFPSLSGPVAVSDPEEHSRAS